MMIHTTLTAGRAAILDEAFTELQQLQLHHYETAGPDFTRRRLEGLYDLVLGALDHRDVGSVIAYADAVAEERFTAGFDVSEVQLAFNVLESAMWRAVVPTESHEDLAEAVGLLSTVFGIAKDALARTYVSLASQRHVPSLDLTALFSGTNSLAGAAEQV